MSPLLYIGIDVLHNINDMIGDGTLSMVCVLLNEATRLKNIRVQGAEALQRLRDARLLHILQCVTVLESIDQHDTNLVDLARSARIMAVNIKYTQPTVVGIKSPLTQTMKIKI